VTSERIDLPGFTIALASRDLDFMDACFAFPVGDVAELAMRSQRIAPTAEAWSS